MNIKCKFGLGQKVMLIHDPEHLHRMVAQVSVGGTGIRYNLVCGTADTWHYEMELDAAPDAKKPAGFNIVKG